MKNQPFLARLRFAFTGLAHALKAENSFRVQALFAAGVLVGLLILRPSPSWWAIMAITVTIVLAAELFNTAVEELADHLHPDVHPRIKVVKDCAAAAVLVTTIGGLCVAAAFFWELLAAR